MKIFIVLFWAWTALDSNFADIRVEEGTILTLLTAPSPTWPGNHELIADAMMSKRTAPPADLLFPTDSMRADPPQKYFTNNCAWGGAVRLTGCTYGVGCWVDGSTPSWARFNISLLLVQMEDWLSGDDNVPEAWHDRFLGSIGSTIAWHLSQSQTKPIGVFIADRVWCSTLFLSQLWEPLKHVKQLKKGAISGSWSMA